jgi:hypothetical protein
MNQKKLFLYFGGMIFMYDFCDDFMVSRKKLSIVYGKDYHMGVVDSDYVVDRRNDIDG